MSGVDITELVSSKKDVPNLPATIKLATATVAATVAELKKFLREFVNSLSPQIGVS